MKGEKPVDATEYNTELKRGVQMLAEFHIS